VFDLLQESFILLIMRRPDQLDEQYSRWGRTNVLYKLSIIPISRDRIVLLIIPRVLLALEYACAQCWATIKSSTTITPGSFSSLVIPSWTSFMWYLEWMFVRPTCITLHLSTLNAICQMFESVSSLSSWLLAVLISLVSSANFNIELIIPQSKCKGVTMPTNIFVV